MLKRHFSSGWRSAVVFVLILPCLLASGEDGAGKSGGRGGGKVLDATTNTVATDNTVDKPATALTSDPFHNLLVLSSLDGTLTGVDRVTGEQRWMNKDDKPMIQVPAEAGSSAPKAPYFLPDPKTGSLYVMGDRNSLRKMPFTIPQLVAMAPCRNSEGLMYTGKKSDTWLQLNPFTGEKSEVGEYGDLTCPAWSSSTTRTPDSCSASNQGPGYRSVLIGKTEYTLSMMDGPRRWNVTYHHYSSKDMSPQGAQDYDLVHFTSPSQGSLMTYDRTSGELLWHKELPSPVIAMYTIDSTSTHLVSVPFNPIAADTLNRLKSSSPNTNKPLSSTTYVGECPYGVYAVPALADEKVLMITSGSSMTQLNLIEGPVDDGSSQYSYLVFGYYKSDTVETSVSTTSPVPPLIEGEHSTNDSGLLEDKVIPITDDHQPHLSTSENIITDFPPAPPQKKVTKEIKIVFSTALISLAVSSSIFGILFIAYRRYKNNQLALQHKLLSSDHHHTSGSTGSTSDPPLTRQDSDNYSTIGKIGFYPSEVLGKGCEGTFVYRGKFEDRDVAVKRILPECFQFADREVDLLKESDQHANVIRYFCTETDGQFRYIALELCIATVHDWIEGKYKNDKISGVDVIREATQGLAHLHSLRIVHRDVKPANVLLNVSVTEGGVTSVRTMISDFGLCKKIQSGRMSYSRRSGGVPGTEGWIAPEVMRDSVLGGSQGVGGGRMTYSVDIFSMGCVFYYVLTQGQHPFGDPLRRQSNILSGEHNLDGVASNPRGALDLIRVMISSDATERPPLTAVLSHPMFWSNDKTLGFFLDVSDRIEKESNDTFPLLRRLEAGALPVVKGDWRDHICSHVAMDLRKYRTYKGESVRDLLRALRNKKNHYRELTLEAQESLGAVPDQFAAYWVERFPLLLVYTWVKFEALRHESVFSKYYDSGGFEFESDERGGWEEYEYESAPVIKLEELDKGQIPKLDKEFWKSKSQAKYQKWRGRGRGGGGSPRHNNAERARVVELSASTDDYWRGSTGREDVDGGGRGSSPGRSPGRSPVRRRNRNSEGREENNANNNGVS